MMRHVSRRYTRKLTSKGKGEDSIDKPAWDVRLHTLHTHTLAASFCV